jgi:hypothetical protein
VNDPYTYLKGSDRGEGGTTTITRIQPAGASTGRHQAVKARIDCVGGSLKSSLACEESPVDRGMCQCAEPKVLVLAASEIIGEPLTKLVPLVTLDRTRKHSPCAPFDFAAPELAHASVIRRHVVLQTGEQFRR